MLFQVISKFFHSDINPDPYHVFHNTVLPVSLEHIDTSDTDTESRNFLSLDNKYMLLVTFYS